ncbi:MAG: ECF-type sigma factor [Planctomycetota bacterium]
MDDRELIALVKRAAAGDRQATDELVRTYMERVRDHVSRRVGQRLRRRIETEDILQSSLALAVRDLEGRDLEFEGERPFVAWLLKITERKIQMAARHHGAGKRAVDRQVPLEEPGGHFAGATSPSQVAARNERAERIQSALADLDPRTACSSRCGSWTGSPSARSPTASVQRPRMRSASATCGSSPAWARV